jgi:hypothetical protein
MKKVIYIGLSLSFGCSDGDEILGVCYISSDLDIICTEEYNPDCACNNLLYGNSCEAEKTGNLNYKLTDLDSGQKYNF